MTYTHIKTHNGNTAKDGYPTAANETEFLLNVFKNNISVENILSEIDSQNIDGWMDDRADIKFALSESPVNTTFNVENQTYQVERIWPTEELLNRWSYCYRTTLPNSSVLQSIEEFITHY